MLNASPSISSRYVPQTSSGLVVPAVLLITLGIALILGATGQFALLRFFYPAAAFVLAAFFFAVYPAVYVEFIWYLWFFTPFIRRIIDFQAGWMNPNPVLLAPFLATGVSVLALFRNLGRMPKSTNAAFGLVIIGILYGYLVGVVRINLFAATFNLLEWAVPVLFGLFLTLTWKNYPAYQQRIMRAFRVGVFLMGTYALIQFFFLPEWDAYWMVNAELDSVGKAEPLEVRIFSTMNSPAPFGHIMMAGLLLVFSGISVGSLAAVSPGLGAFLLSLSRQSWGGWLLGLMVVAFKAQGRFRARLINVLILSSLVALPLLATDAIYSRISTRFDSISNIGEDNSLGARLAAYRGVSVRILNDPIGYGLGATGTAQKHSGGENNANLDSGFLDIPIALGWVGGFLYLFGLYRLMWPYALSRPFGDDQFAIISFGIFVGMFAMMAFGKVQSDVSGMVMWTFVGTTVAAGHYHHNRAKEDAALQEA